MVLFVIVNGLRMILNLPCSSDVLHCNLLEVLAPVLGEAHLFFAFLIELAHDIIEALLESLFKDLVIFVPCANYALMMECVLHFDLAGDLVLDPFGTFASSG